MPEQSPSRSEDYNGYNENKLHDEPDFFDENDKEFSGEEDEERQQIMKQKYDEYFSTDGDAIAENLEG